MFELKRDVSPNTLKTCVTDAVGNSRGPYVKVTLNYRDLHDNQQSVALVQVRNTTGSGTQVCRTDNVAHIGDLLDLPVDFRVEKGECSGTTCTKYVTDIEGFTRRCFSSFWAPYCEDHTWTNNVAFRYSTGPDGDICDTAPSPTNCNSVFTNLTTADEFLVQCQQKGAQTVGSNPYWLRVVIPGGLDTKGWIPSWYLDSPKNWVDGVPYCQFSDYALF